jgi:membrane protease YdiL (CAAX protease family)
MAHKLPDHLRVPWTIPQALLVFGGAWIVMPVILILLLDVVSLVLPLAATLLKALSNGDIAASFGLDVIDAIAALGLVFVYLRRNGVGWATVGWRRPKLWATLAYLIGGFFGFFILVAIVLTLVGILDPSFNANQTQTNEYTGGVATHRNLTLIALVLIPPIIEETVFRGFIFPAIAKKWDVWVGAIGSSALFGLAHLQANVSIYTFVLGLVLCVLYVKLRSIFPGMAIHMINNLLAYYALASK